MPRVIQQQVNKLRYIAKSKAPPFGVLSLEIARRIGNASQVAALSAANYRYLASIRELEQQFEAKAAELREAYLEEVGEVHDGIEAS